MTRTTRSTSRACACLLSAFLAMVGTAGQANVLTVTAQGNIAPVCSIAPTQPFASQNFNAAGSATANAAVTCNQFFRINATSQKGAIKTNAPASGSLTNTLPYSLTADVALDSGSVTATCASATLLAGQSSCTLSPANSAGLTSNGQIATNKTTTLTVSWTPPSLPTQLVTGSYSDTITISVATAP